MDRTARIYEIDRLLRQHQVCSFSKLQAALEVSRATLKRDLDYLRHRLNAPVTWSRAEGGYRLQPSSDADSALHELPGLWFSSGEIQALLTMQHLLNNLDAGGMLTHHVAPLMKRLDALLGGSDTEAAQIRRRVRLIGLAQRSVQPWHFQCVAAALVQRKRLALTYHARGTGEMSEREVSPLRLVHYRGNWYLDAWCHLRRSLRNFALDAIVDAALTDALAKEVSDTKLDATFGPSYGIFSGRRIRWARLHFTAERARWVASEQWHPQQKGKLQADGSYLLRIPYADDRELIMDLLKHGAHCEVLGPASLRLAVLNELEKMREKYF